MQKYKLWGTEGKICHYDIMWTEVLFLLIAKFNILILIDTLFTLPMLYTFSALFKIGILLIG